MSEYTIKWTAPDNTVIQLSGESYYTVLAGDGGWFMPNTSLIFDYYTSHAKISRVRFDPRIINMPIRIVTSTQSQMDTAIEALCKAFNPLSEAEGTLQVTRHDGAVREIKGIYWSGLEGFRTIEKYHKLWFDVSIDLKCPNGMWYNPTQVTETWTEGSPGTFFPFFPLDLAAGALFGATVVNNAGSASAWPIWEVDGPAVNPTFKNVTTGKEMALTLTLLTGETLIIDSSPGVKTIKVGSLNKFSTLSVSSEIWPLQPGNQTIDVIMSGTGASTEVRLKYYPRYVSL